MKKDARSRCLRPEELGCRTECSLCGLRVWRGSRLISSDVLRTKPEGEKGVRLGLDNHTGRYHNISLTACVVSRLEHASVSCCVTQYMSLGDTARVYSMSQTREMIGCEQLIDRLSLVWVNQWRVFP